MAEGEEQKCCENDLTEGDFEVEDDALDCDLSDMTGDDVGDVVEVEEVDSHSHGVGGAADTSAEKTFLNLVKSFVGSGILGLPFAFKQAGALLAMGVLFLLALVTNYCIRLLLQVNDKLAVEEGKKTLSYARIGKLTFGAVGNIITTLSLSFTQLGFCCVYVIFILDNCQEVYEEIPCKALVTSESRWGYTIMMAALLMILANIRSFKILAYVSLFGQIAMIASLAVICFYASKSLVEYAPRVDSVNLWGFPVFFGTAAYSYEGIGLVLPLRRAMKKPTHFSFVLDMGYVAVFFFYLIIGVLGYIGFGPCTRPEITLNLPDSIIGDSVKLLMVASIFATYPVQLFPITAMVESFVFSHFGSTSQWFQTQRNFIRCCLVVLTIIIALSVPNFSLLVTLVGAFGCSMIAFILPAAFHLRVFPNAPIRRRLLTWVVLLFGIGSSLLSGSVAFYDLFTAVFLPVKEDISKCILV